MRKTSGVPPFQGRSRTAAVSVRRSGLALGEGGSSISAAAETKITGRADEAPCIYGFVAQGGDWGVIITDLMGTRGVSEALGIDSDMPGVFQTDIDKAALSSAPAPSGFLPTTRSRTSSRPLYTRGYRLRRSDGIRPRRCTGSRSLSALPVTLDYDVSMVIISVPLTQPEGRRGTTCWTSHATWSTKMFPPGRVSTASASRRRLCSAPRCLLSELVHYDKLCGDTLRPGGQPKLFAEEIMRRIPSCAADEMEVDARGNHPRILICQPLGGYSSAAVVAVGLSTVQASLEFPGSSLSSFSLSTIRQSCGTDGFDLPHHVAAMDLHRLR